MILIKSVTFHYLREHNKQRRVFICSSRNLAINSICLKWWMVKTTQYIDGDLVPYFMSLLFMCAYFALFSSPFSAHFSILCSSFILHSDTSKNPNVRNHSISRLLLHMTDQSYAILTTGVTQGSQHEDLNSWQGSHLTSSPVRYNKLLFRKLVIFKQCGRTCRLHFLKNLQKTTVFFYTDTTTAVTFSYLVISIWIFIT